MNSPSACGKGAVNQFAFAAIDFAPLCRRSKEHSMCYYCSELRVHKFYLYHVIKGGKGGPVEATYEFDCEPGQCSCQLLRTSDTLRSRDFQLQPQEDVPR